MVIIVFGGMGLFAWTAAYLSDGAPRPTIGFCAYGFVVVLGLSTLAVPSKNTFYLIAGSEAGEAVITSPEGEEIIRDIKKIIKQQINGAVK